MASNAILVSLTLKNTVDILKIQIWHQNFFAVEDTEKIIGYIKLSAVSFYDTVFIFKEYLWKQELQ